MSNAPFTLITSIGTGNYIPTVYNLNGATWEAPYCSAALCRLLQPGPAHVVVLLTREARQKTWPAFREALLAAGAPEPEILDIPDGANADEVWQIFDTLLEAVKEARRLVLDVTFALRSLPFVYFTTIGFLRSLNGVELGGIYYGAFDKQSDGTTSIVDLGALVTLMDWSYAVQSFRETGNLQAVSLLLKDHVRELFRQSGGGGPRDLSSVKDNIVRLAPVLGATLSPEIGLEAGILQRNLAALTSDTASLPGTAPARYLFESLRQVIAPLAVKDSPDRKDKIPLDEAELAREMEVAKFYLGHSNLPGALLLLREWMVNRVLLADGCVEGWLNLKVRQRAEGWLHLLETQQKRDRLTGLQRDIARCWSTLRTWRNTLAHGGFKPEEFKAGRERVENLINDLCTLNEDEVAWRFNPGCAGEELVLVTGLGMSPGVLYSGVLHLKPQRVVVFTSREAAAAVTPALSQAGCAGLPRQVLLLDDPFTDFARADYLVKTALAETLWARQLVCNLTGGTTAIQFAVQRLGQSAAQNGLPVRYVALVDRRPPEEQRHNPWVLGQLVEVDVIAAMQLTGNMAVEGGAP